MKKSQKNTYSQGKFTKSYNTMTYMAEKNREFIRLAVTREAKDKLDHVTELRDMKLIGVASRIIEWFVDQDEFLQTVILGLIPQKDQGAVAKLILKRLENEEKSKKPDELSPDGQIGLDAAEEAIRHAQSKKRKKTS